MKTTISLPDAISDQTVPILWETGLRVQTVVLAAQQWGLSAKEIAVEYDITDS